jgi:hypothetical protein
LNIKMDEIRSNVLLNTCLGASTLVFVILYTVSGSNWVLHLLSALFLYWALFFWLHVLQHVRLSKDKAHLANLAMMKELRVNMKRERKMLGDKLMDLSGAQKVHEILKAKRNHHSLGSAFAMYLVFVSVFLLSGWLSTALVAVNCAYLGWNISWLTYYVVARRKWEAKRVAELEWQVSEIQNKSEELGRQLEGM